MLLLMEYLRIFCHHRHRKIKDTRLYTLREGSLTTRPIKILFHMLGHAARKGHKSTLRSLQEIQQKMINLASSRWNVSSTAAASSASFAFLASMTDWLTSPSKRSTKVKRRETKGNEEKRRETRGNEGNEWKRKETKGNQRIWRMNVYEE